jgi:Flp pilus assembly protein TadD
MDRPIFIGWLAIALAAVALGPGCAQRPQWVQNPLTYRDRDRDMRFSFAQVIERDGNLYRAEKQYRELQQEAPKDPRFAHRLGVVLIRQGRTEEGVAFLEEAAKHKADDVAILNDLGYAYTVAGDYAAAEEHLRLAMTIDNRDSRTINNLALAIGYAGRTQEAYELFRRNGSEAEARANVAYVLAQRGELKHAVDEYNRALNKDPDYKPAAEGLVQLTQIGRELQATADSGVQYAKTPAASANDLTQVRHQSSPPVTPVAEPPLVEQPFRTDSPAPSTDEYRLYDLGKFGSVETVE